MEWESWSTFWTMGGAGWFVWGSYGVTAVCIIAELFLVFRRQSDTVRRLLRLRRAAPSGGRMPGARKENV